jgi:hypothetical protein|tara:strand:- start:486 stop:731 length:246 start_codon:yes stop_codon:yes gene_type:complete
MEKIEFISERKVVKTMHNIDKAIEFVNQLRNARVKNQSSIKEIWNNVGELLEVDPFLQLSIRVKNNNKIVAKNIVWKSSLK